MKLKLTTYLTAALIAATSIPTIAQADTGLVDIGLPGATIQSEQLTSTDHPSAIRVGFNDSIHANAHSINSPYVLTAVKFSSDLSGDLSRGLKDVNSVTDEHLEILHFSNALSTEELYY